MRQAIHSMARLLISFTIAASAIAPAIQAADMALESKYQDVFVSAGYATALGAGIGAALLSFQDKPTEHLKYVAVGASVGFFAGTAFGTYMVLKPSFALNDETKPQSTFVAGDAKAGQLVIQPTVSTSSWSLRGVEAGMVLAQF